jgi:hypothetical protein
MAFDSARGVTVLYGGHIPDAEYNALSDETWEWNGTVWSNPAGPLGCANHAECPDDGDGCTNELCVEGVCTPVYNSAPCDDSMPCTASAECREGVCTPMVFVPGCAPRMFVKVVAVNGVSVVPTETVEVLRGDEVTLDVFAENWSSNLPERTLRTAQGAIDTAGFTSGSGGSLALLSDPTGEAGLFQDITRSDWVLPGAGTLSGCDVSSTGPRCFATVDSGSCRTDPGVPAYFFTAVLVVSDDASGTFTITVDGPVSRSFIADCAVPPVAMPVEVGHAEVRIGADCNANGIADTRDLAEGASADCNANGIPDECDIASQFAADLNLNGIPDDCEMAPSAMPDPSGIHMNRSLAFFVQPVVTAAANLPTAIRVSMVRLQNPWPPNPTCCPPPDFTAFESATCNPIGELSECARWVGKPGVFLEAQNNLNLGDFNAARLQCTPYYHDWSAEGLLHVVGAEILASSTYEVVHFAAMCLGHEDTCSAQSAPLIIQTARFGDIASPFSPPSTSAQPDSLDVVAMVNKFRNLAGAPSKRAAQIQPNLPELNADINAIDIVTVVDAFRGLAYPFSGPCPCPSSVNCNATWCSSAAQCSGGMCVKTCSGGTNSGQPCITNAHCPSGACGSGFCRDRCGRCRD